MIRTLYSDDNLRVFERCGSFIVRYDAGSHQIEIREDVISKADAEIAASGPDGAASVLFALQRRLLADGFDPYKSNVE